jgi:hypothetical protein
MGMYHWESNQEDFLLLAGNGLLLVERQERRLRKWDLVHCPPQTKHIILSNGDEPSGEARELAQQQLEQARKALSSRRLEVESSGRSALRPIVSNCAADERDGGLIVVGSRDHGFIERLLTVGSTRPSRSTAGATCCSSTELECTDEFSGRSRS